MRRPGSKTPSSPATTLYHPDGWASGELDMVLRWDGRPVSSTSNSAPRVRHFRPRASLRFYAWLWHETHEGQTVHGMGDGTRGCERAGYEPLQADEMEMLTTTYKQHFAAMQSYDA